MAPVARGFNKVDFSCRFPERGGKKYPIRITKMGEEMGILNLVLGVLDGRVDEIRRFAGKRLKKASSTYLLHSFEAITI